jgi:hypothetical protein
MHAEVTVVKIASYGTSVCDMLVGPCWCMYVAPFGTE